MQKTLERLIELMSMGLMGRHVSPTRRCVWHPKPWLISESVPVGLIRVKMDFPLLLPRGTAVEKERRCGVVQSSRRTTSERSAVTRGGQVLPNACFRSEPRAAYRCRRSSPLLPFPLPSVLQPYWTGPPKRIRDNGTIQQKRKNRSARHGEAYTTVVIAVVQGQHKNVSTSKDLEYSTPSCIG